MRLALASALVLAAATFAGPAPSQTRKTPQTPQTRPTADLHIVVRKRDRTLSLYEGPKHLVKCYRVALGTQPTGPKQVEGDGATPEGEYYVTHGNPQSKFHLSLGPFRQVVKDYDQICQSYYEAVRTLPPSAIETVDMARRGIHNEGARILQERLEGKATLDQDTARRLFTLICVLRPGG